MNTIKKELFASLLFVLFLLSGCSATSPSKDTAAVEVEKPGSVEEFNKLRKQKISEVLAESQEKIKFNKLARQVRIDDIYANKQEELNDLDEKKQAEKEKLNQAIENELSLEQDLLNERVQSLLKETKNNAKGENLRVIAEVEREVSSFESQVESELTKEILKTEVEKISDYMRQERRLERDHKFKLAVEKTKIDSKNKKRLEILAEELKSKRQYNENLVKLKADFLEKQRAETEAAVRRKAQAENKAITDKLANKYIAEVNKFEKDVMTALAEEEKRIISNLNAKFFEAKKERSAKERKRLSESTTKGKDAKLEAGSKKRTDLIPIRDAKIVIIENELEDAIRQIRMDKKQELASLKIKMDEKHADGLGDIEISYSEKSEQVENKAKVLEKNAISRYELKAEEIESDQERKINAINKEIDTMINKIKS